MPNYLINKKAVRFHAVDRIPDPFKPFFTKKIIGKHWHYSGEFGEILFNNLYAGDTQIWVRYFHIKRPCQIRLYQKKNLLGLMLALQNNLNYIIQNLNCVECNERCYNFFYLPEDSLDLDFKKEGTYISFESVAINNPRNWLKHYPIINKAIPMLSNIPFILFSYSEKITIPQQKILDDLQQSLREKAALEAQVIVKLSTVFALFLETGLPKGNKEKVEFWHIAQIEAATNFIKEHYQTHYNITALSREFGMCTTAFKKNFKRITGFTPLEYLLKIRKEKVIEMLGSGMPLKEAALLVGYETERGFRKAFKMTNWPSNMSDCTPGPESI